MLKVIAGIRYNGKLIRLKHLRQPKNQFGAANTAGQSEVMTGVRDVH
jgi:hypothetical protein